MELLGPQLYHVGEKIRGLPHTIRESWPLNRVPRSRDWELLVITYLVLVTLALALFFTFTHNTPYGL